MGVVDAGGGAMEECLRKMGYEGERLERQRKKLAGHPDIAKEFLRWVESGEFGEIEVEGYTAEKIKEMAPFLTGLGVYNFLVDLRESPEEMKKYIEEGLKEL